MKLGLIARADNSGLGVQTWEFARHMQPAKVLLIDVGAMHDNTTHCNKATYRERYSAPTTVCKGWQPGIEMLTQFLRGLDVVVTCETPYGPHLIPLARRMGVRTVICPNYEFLDRSHQPDLWAAPSMWHWDEIPHPKDFLPVPIALDRFTERDSNSGPRHFLHVVGRPAIFDRNGTPQLLAALQYVRSHIRVTLKCQDAEYLQQVTANAQLPANVELITDSGDVRDYWDNYHDGDVMILPRRYGGLCLPANEALGAGMPVIMTDISPNNTWLPPEWLVSATKAPELPDGFTAFQPINVFTADTTALVAKIEQFATDEQFYAAAKSRAAELAKEYSWDNLLPEYKKVLSG